MYINNLGTLIIWVHLIIWESLMIWIQVNYETMSIQFHGSPSTTSNKETFLQKFQEIQACTPEFLENIENVSSVLHA